MPLHSSERQTSLIASVLPRYLRSRPTGRTVPKRIQPVGDSMSIRSANLVLVCCALIVGSHALVPGKVAHAADSPNGVAGSMPAYYDHTLFTINFFQLTTAQATLLAKNSQQNIIYQSDPGLPGGAPFISVIDA